MHAYSYKRSPGKQAGMVLSYELDGLRTTNHLNLNLCFKSRNTCGSKPVVPCLQVVISLQDLIKGLCPVKCVNRCLGPLKVSILISPERSFVNTWRDSITPLCKAPTS